MRKNFNSECGIELPEGYSFWKTGSLDYIEDENKNRVTTFSNGRAISHKDALNILRSNVNCYGCTNCTQCVCCKNCYECIACVSCSGLKGVHKKRNKNKNKANNAKQVQVAGDNSICVQICGE